MILGKLIPAGTGLDRYRNIRVEPTPEAKAQAYSMVGYDSFDYDFGQGSGAAVPLEEFDLGDYAEIKTGGAGPGWAPPPAVPTQPLRARNRHSALVNYRVVSELPPSAGITTIKCGSLQLPRVQGREDDVGQQERYVRARDRVFPGGNRADGDDDAHVRYDGDQLPTKAAG